MKKRLIPITLAIVMLMAFIPFGPAAVAEEVEYLARFGAQMADPINGWELGEVAETKFKLNEEATIKIDFGQTTNFGDGNYIAIETSLDVPEAFHGMDPFQSPPLAEVLSFTLDGNYVSMNSVFLNAEGMKDETADGKDGLRLTLANFWSSIPGGDMPVRPAQLGDFNTLEITFIVRGVYFAQFAAQMSDDIGWELGDFAATGFVLGQPAVLDIDFGDKVNFGDGNYVAINTNLPNTFDGIFADTDMAQILSFQLDGNEIPMGDVLLNPEGLAPLDGSDNEGVRLNFTNKWNGDISEQPFDPDTVGDFQTLRIEFIIHYVGDPPEPPPPEAVELQMSGIAYIGGTFEFMDGNHLAGGDDLDRCDWWAFEDQATPIEIGVPFTVSIDMGSEKIRHGLAAWNDEDYIIAVDTDIASPPAFFDAYIDKIVKDGNEVSFNADNVTVGAERGNLRISLTNSWAESAGDPVPIAGPNSIGEFSKLEVTMVIVELDEPNPFAGNVVQEAPPTPMPTPTPPENREEPKSGLPGWVIPVIIGGVAVIAVVVVLVVLKNKKKA
ncbi:MAG: hypothetical protein FWD38_03470 [Oscillospiraceae bacterium]|nr:hypothetical protein [Oscillospiraceae bacterium]